MAFFVVKIYKNNNAIAITKNICNVFTVQYSRDAVNIRINQLWFPKFKSEKFSLIDKNDNDILLYHTYYYTIILLDHN